MTAQNADSEFMKLLEIGYAGLSKGYLIECHAIFDALTSFLPDSPHPTIALAMVKFHSGQPQVAIEILERCIDRFPTMYVARGVLAKFLYAQRNPDWQMHAQYVIEHDKPGSLGWDAVSTLLQEQRVHLPLESTTVPSVDYMHSQSRIRFA
jgi:predicted Zn-dependent protease